MKAFVVYEAGKFGLTEMPVPVIKDNEVLVRVGAASICHSDFDIIEGRRTSFVKFPVVLGHEFAGTVEKVGKTVACVKPGDKVACECGILCGVCRNCRLGFIAPCQNYNELGTMENGGFAEYAAVPAEMVHRFDKITMEAASNVEPAGNAYHAVERAEILTGDKVAVIGPGPIGLYALQIARLKSPEMLIMVGTRDDRLGVASELGATEIINIRKTDPFKRIMEITENKGVDRVIQCATTKDAMELGLGILGHNSRMVIEGVSESEEKTGINFNDFIGKYMTITGAAGAGRRHFINTLKLMELGLINTERVITHKIPLDKIEDGLELLKSRKDGAIKVAINP